MSHCSVGVLRLGPVSLPELAPVRLRRGLEKAAASRCLVCRLCNKGSFSIEGKLLDYLGSPGGWTQHRADHGGDRFCRSTASCSV